MPALQVARPRGRCAAPSSQSSLRCGVVEEHGRRALDDLLVAPLHRAVALEQVHEVAVRDRRGSAPRRAARGAPASRGTPRRCRTPPSPRDARRPPSRPVAIASSIDAHAAAAAAPARLEHHRVADACARGARLPRVVGRQRRRRGHDRHAGATREVARRDLVAEAAHHLGRRADEHDPGRGAGLGELRVLRQEAVARMDGIGAGLDGDAHDVVDVEVGLDRALALADQVALVRLHAVQREAVLLRVDRDRADAQLVGRTHDADRDLAAVRDEQGLYRAGLAHERIARGSGSCRRARDRNIESDGWVGVNRKDDVRPRVSGILPPHFS